MFGVRHSQAYGLANGEQGLSFFAVEHSGFPENQVHDTQHLVLKQQRHRYRSPVSLLEKRFFRFRLKAIVTVHMLTDNDVFQGDSDTTKAALQGQA